MKEMDGDVLRVHLVAGCCEHANEPSDSIKCRGCMDQMGNCWPPKKDAVLWSSVEFSFPVEPQRNPLLFTIFFFNFVAFRLPSN